MPPSLLCFEGGHEVPLTDIQLACPASTCQHSTNWLSPKIFIDPDDREKGLGKLSHQAALQWLRTLCCPIHTRLRLTPVCPVCPRHPRLWSAFQDEDHVVSLAGTFYSGKTTLLAALERRIQQAWGKPFDTVVAVWPTDQAAVYTTDVRTHYLKGEPPDKTWTNQYFCFEIRSVRNSWPPRPWWLTVYDVPGEAYENIEQVQTNLFHLAYTDQLLFVLNPYLISSLAPHLPPLEDPRVAEKVQRLQAQGVESILKILTEFFRQYQARPTHHPQAPVHAAEKVDVDLAITIPRLDEFPPRFLPRAKQGLLFPQPPVGRVASFAQLARASKEAKALLKGPFDLWDFVNTAEGFFRQVGFFFVTAWGPDGPQPDPQPAWVENPLLWLMYQRMRRRRIWRNLLPRRLR